MLSGERHFGWETRITVSDLFFNEVDKYALVYPSMEQIPVLGVNIQRNLDKKLSKHLLGYFS